MLSAALLPFALLPSVLLAAPLEVLPGAEPTQVVVTAALAGDAAAQSPAGALDQEAGERWLRFALVDEASGKPGLPMFGKYERAGAVLKFTPRYALSPNRLYRATLVGADQAVTVDYRVPPKVAGEPARVEQIYPSGDKLPANLLKFYIHFSKPMREGAEIFDRFTILDDQGQAVEDPWRRTELWTSDARRLTLNIHPGRIKQGVNLREELGPVLEPGRKYTLVVEATLLDADGQPLREKYTKTFTTLAEDRDRPIPRLWKLTPPKAGTRDALVVEFGESLDRALAERYLKVWDAAEQRIAGKATLGAGEQSWSFTPAEPWKAARYTLTAEAELEDAAGNTPQRLFDTDLSLPSPEPPTLNVPFEAK